MAGLSTVQPPSNAAGTPGRTRGRGGWFRRGEILAWTLGLVLLAVWGLGRLVGNALEQRDLRRFERAREATVTPAEPPARVATALPRVDPHAVDQSRWDYRRIQAYVRALNEDAPPPLAVLRIPRIGLEVPVLEGTDELTLDRAVGWIEGTARPGEPGNVGIAGHRDGFFRGLKDVKSGDSIELLTLTGAQSFRVAEIRIVSPDDVRVLHPTVVPVITLVTCFPFYFVGSAPKRFVVRAALSSAQAAAPHQPGLRSK
jgi:sortase A